MTVILPKPKKKEIQQNDSPAKILPFRPRQPTAVEPGARLALAWLRSSIASPKEFALRLGIGERQVYKWINQEACIPRERIGSILWAGIDFMTALFRLREETDCYLVQTRHFQNSKWEEMNRRFESIELDDSNAVARSSA